MAARPWASIALDWFEDPVLDVIADERPEVFALWPVLMAMCTGVSHVQKNPRGRLEVSVGRLARAIRVDHATVSAVLDLLETGELIAVESSGPGMVIELVRFEKWQKPKGSKAKWMRDKRNELCREKDAECGQPVDNGGEPVGLPVPVPVQIEEKKTSKSASDIDPSVLDKKKQLEANITTVLEHWQNVFGHHRRAITGAAAKQRRTRVKTQLDLFTVEQLCTAIDGQATRTWLVENGHTEVTNILQPGKVEAAIELASSAATGAGQEITLDQFKSMNRGERSA